MVRDMQRQAEKHAAADEERLAAAREEAAKHEGEANSEAALAQIAALNEQVAVYRKKYTSLLHKQVVHRIIKGQSTKILEKMRDGPHPHRPDRPPTVIDGH